MGGAHRFKRDLPATPVQEGEYRFFEIQKSEGDPVRLYDFEYNLALELDGRDCDAVAAAANTKYGLELSAEQVLEFARSLGELGLLLPDPPAAAPPAEDAAPENEWHRDVSEPTTLMEGMEGLTELLARASSRTGEVPAIAPAPEASQTSQTSQTSIDGMVKRAVVDVAAPIRARESGAVAGELDENTTKKRDEAVVHAGPNTSDEITAPVNDSPRADAAPMAEVPARPAPPPMPVLEVPAASAPVAVAAPAPQPPASEWSDLMRPASLAVPDAPEATETPAFKLPVETPRPRSRVLFFAVLGILVALAVAGFAVYKFVLPGGEQPLSVRTVQPSPVSVYRWFETEGQVRAAPPRELAFENGGKVIEIRAPGSRFTKDDVLALLDGGKALRTQLLHHRERLAFYQQMFESMKAEGNRAEMRQAEIKMTEKAQLVEETRAALAHVAIVADGDGEVAEALVEVGARVSAGDKALRLAGSRHQAVFEFGRDDAARAGRLAFCRAWLGDRPVDCDFTPNTDEATRVVVDLADDVDAKPGETVRLARTRFDAVFAVPASALVELGEGDRLFVASPNGRAEMRAVSLAERTRDEAIVTQGLDVGDEVIIEVPPQLRPNAPVSVRERRLQ